MIYELKCALFLCSLVSFSTLLYCGKLTVSTIFFALFDHKKKKETIALIGHTFKGKVTGHLEYDVKARKENRLKIHQHLLVTLTATITGV